MISFLLKIHDFDICLNCAALVSYVWEYRIRIKRVSVYIFYLLTGESLPIWLFAKSKSVGMYMAKILFAGICTEPRLVVWLLACWHWDLVDAPSNRKNLRQKMSVQIRTGTTGSLLGEMMCEYTGRQDFKFLPQIVGRMFWHSVELTGQLFGHLFRVSYSNVSGQWVAVLSCGFLSLLLHLSNLKKKISEVLSGKAKQKLVRTLKIFQTGSKSWHSGKIHSCLKQDCFH